MSLSNGYIPRNGDSTSGPHFATELLETVDSDCRRLSERGQLTRLSDLLTVMVGALGEWGIEPEPKSVTECGFTVRLQGHLVRIESGHDHR